MEKKRILLVCGGVETEFFFKTSVFYTTFAPYLNNDNDKYEIVLCIIFPDGMINFPKSLDEKDYSVAEKFDIFEAGCKIKKMNIDCILYVPNGWKALTTYKNAFELLDIPIANSLSESQMISFNKIMTKARLQLEGIPFPNGFIVRKDNKDDVEYIQNQMKEKNLTYPLMVKAVCEDDSRGVFRVFEEKELLPAINESLKFKNYREVLIEEFIVGRELRTNIIQDETFEMKFLPIIDFGIEVNEFRNFDYKVPEFKASKNEKHRFAENKTFVDPEKEASLYQRLKDISMKTFKILNARDSLVCDFRYNQERDQIYMIETGLFNHFCKICNICLHSAMIGIPLEKTFDIGVNNAIRRFNEAKAAKKEEVMN